MKRRSQAKEQQLSEAKGQEEGGGGTDTLTGGASILLDQPGLPVIEEAAAAQGEAGSMVDWLAKGQAGAGDQAYQRIDEETPADFEGNGPKGAQEDVNEGRVREGDEGEMRKEVMCEEKEVEMRKEDAQGKDEEQIILEAKIGDEGLGEEERMGQELQKEDTEAAEAEGPGRKGGMEDLLVEGKGIAADGHSAAFSLVSEDLGCSLGTVEQDNSGWGPSAPLSSAHTSGSPTQETPRSSLKPRGEDVGAFKRVQAAHAGNLEGAPDAQGCNKQLGGAEPENPTEVQEREEAEASYMRLTVIKLKEELRTRRLPVSGTKAVLVRRLMDNDAQALRGRRIGELEVTPEEVSGKVKDVLCLPPSLVSPPSLTSQLPRTILLGLLFHPQSQGHLMAWCNVSSRGPDRPRQVSLCRPTHLSRALKMDKGSASSLATAQRCFLMGGLRRLSPAAHRRPLSARRLSWRRGGPKTKPPMGLVTL